MPKHMVSGGIIIFDDYAGGNSVHRGCVEAVHEMFGTAIRVLETGQAMVKV